MVAACWQHPDDCSQITDGKIKLDHKNRVTGTLPFNMALGSSSIIQSVGAKRRR